MRVTNSYVKMTSLGGHKHGPYDVALDYIPQGGIVFSFGLGDQIGLEEKLIAEKNVTIYGFDPMPKSEQYVLSRGLNNLKFQRVALMTADDSEKCYLPEKEDYTSGSLRKENVSWQKCSDEFIPVECHKLKTLMEMNRCLKIDFLKLCIEGAEFEVIDDILRDNLDIKQISIAFCGRGLEGMFEKEKKLYQAMLSAGYDCLPYQNNGKVTFLRKN